MATPESKLKRGTVFVHARWLGDDDKPLRCRITAVRKGVVYWTGMDGDSAKMFFGVHEADKYVGHIES